MKNAVVIALETPSLSTLVKLLKAAGLVETVQGLHNATIFAPTDAAFAKVPAEVVQQLLRPENKHALRQILLTHVLGDEVVSSEIGNASEARSLSGAVLVFHLYMGSVFISAPKSTAKVIKADIRASNQVVIHVIDNVLTA
jgi:uncharacterized surface protein with fasciclin (FAS1) repeats